MNELFKKNHNYIKKAPHIFFIKKGYCPYARDYLPLPAKDGKMGLVFQNGQEKFTLHSLYYPQREAEDFVKNQKIKEAYLVVFGLGLGYILPFLKELPYLKIYLVEPDKSLFNLALQYTDTEDTHPECTFIVGYSEYEAYRIIGNLPAFDLYVLAPFFRFHQPYFELLQKRLRQQPLFGLSENWKYAKFQNEQSKILFIDSAYVLTKECLTAIEETGNIFQYVLLDKDNYNYQEFIRGLLNTIAAFKPDFVLTVNHLGFDRDGKLTELLTELKIPFASWFVDSPTVILSGFEENISPLCNIFVWDSDYLPEIKQAGYPHADYLPLACLPQLFYPQQRGYRYGVGFVGSSMVFSIHKNLKSMVHRADLLADVDYFAREVLLQAQRKVDMLLRQEAENGKTLNFDSDSQKADFMAAVLWRATQIYRLGGIEKLAEFNPVIHGDPNWDQLLGNEFNIKREIVYYDEMPAFYNEVKINFNMTSRQMKQAVNQRVFDVPACAKFVLTDYKQQLDEIFEKGEIVYFREIDEIPELVAFYLKNDSLREKIASLGYARVLKEHTYARRIKKMIEIMRQRYRGL